MSLFTGALALAGAAAAAGATTAAAKMSSSAAQHGADTQSASAQEALDFLKAQKAKQEAAYAPFGALGQQAVSMLPGLARQAPVGGPPAPYTTQPRATAPMPQQPQAGPMSMMGQQPQGMPQQFGAQPMPRNAGPMVMLQAPDGSQKQVPAEQAPFYISRGAKQVG